MKTNFALRILSDYDKYFEQLERNTELNKFVFSDCYNAKGNFILNTAINKAVKIAVFDYPEALKELRQLELTNTLLQRQYSELLSLMKQRKDIDNMINKFLINK